MKFYDKLKYKTLRIRELFGIISSYKQVHSCTRKNCRDCIRHDGHYYCAAYDRFMDPRAIPCSYAIKNNLLVKQRKYRLVIKRGRKT